MPTELLRFLGTDDVRRIELGASVRIQMSVLFADLQGFTTLAERSSPEDTFAKLNELFGRIAPAVRNCGGVVDKFLGDAVMALFPTGPDAAVEAAIRIQEAVRELNGSFLGARQRLNVGIGIHHGPVLLGTVGEAQRFDSTVVSDVVNVASRLEDMCKRLGAGILVSDVVRSGMKSRIGMRSLGNVRLRGRSDRVAFHEVYTGLEPQRQAAIEATRDDVELALRMLSRGEAADALELLTALRRLDPDDGVVAFYVDRLERSFARVRAGQLDPALLHATLEAQTVE